MSHPHDHGGCAGECDHGSDESSELGIQYSLYQKIHLDNVECLNETIDGSGKTVFRAWDDRLNQEKFVESDADEELLFNIPFTGLVKLKGVIVVGGTEDSHPATMKLYKNRPNMTFDDCSSEPEQSFEMTRDSKGTLEYATKVVKFCSVHHLSIHFPRNFGNDITRVNYIGLRGEFSELPRQEVVICTYEAAPNPADHKVNLLKDVSQVL